MGNRLNAWLIVALCMSASANARQPQGLILGRVVDADSGRGVAGALVTLGPPALPAAPIGELLEARPPAPPFSPTPLAGVRRTLTANDGRFLFRDLSKGRFSIYVTSPRHVAGAYGQVRPQGPAQPIELGDGAKLGGVTVKLWRHGSISGMIRDENGEPAVGVSVECSRRVFSGGQRRFASIGVTPATDDRGLYRVAGLPPGDYICGNVLNATTVPIAVASISPAAGGTGVPSEESRRLTNSGASTLPSGIRIGDLFYSSGIGTLRGPVAPPPDANRRVMTYAPQYYGGVTTTAQASTITMKAGEERTGIDIQLKLVPAVRVSGRLIGPDGPAAWLGLRLVPASGDDMVSEGQAEFAKTTSDASGAFTFLGVPSGDYILKSRLYPRPAPGGSVAAALDEATIWTATPITVGSADIANLTVTMRTGIRASGRVEFAGARTPPTAPELQRIGVRLQMAEGRTSSPIALDGRVLADGSFKTAGYPAGRYIANVLPSTVPAGWFVKSITVNGRDVSVEPLQLVDADISGMVVTFTDRTTTLTGSVSGPNGVDPTAEVVVFPADSMAWKDVGVVARRWRAERVNNAGAFSIAGLPPGDYFVAALAGTLAGDRQDPVLLATVMKSASRVTLTDGGTATVRVAVMR